jgi:segregation and condensation protein A
MDQADKTLFPPLIKFEHFDGPLDLLLDEVRRQNVDIEKVRVAPIAARFLEYVRMVSDRNLNLNIEWLHMAATLIHWKSQFLLPAQPGVENPADAIPNDLIRQLLAHKNQVAEELARRRSAAQASFPRAADPDFEGDATPEEADEAKTTTAWDLIQQAREIACWIREHREARRCTSVILEVDSDEVSVSEMIVYLQNQFTAAGGERLDGIRLLDVQTSVTRRSCLFLAMLEMARNRKLEILQNGSFAPISLVQVVR